jgi:hypothetical protein
MALSKRVQQTLCHSNQREGECTWDGALADEARGQTSGETIYCGQECSANKKPPIDGGLFHLQQAIRYRD